MSDLLQVKDLAIRLYTQHGVVHAVNHVSFSLAEQETLAVVGESGSGKSIMCKGIMHLLPSTGRIESGSVCLEGQDIAHYSDRQMRKINGNRIAMIFQDPMTSLNPTMPVGKQITEVLREHTAMTEKQMEQRAVELLGMVGISDPARRMKQYPHQFSGGMRQRVVIAIALACDPGVLIADEPTTALDVTIQAQILGLMRQLQQRIHTSIILITHNLGVVASIAQRVAVMYGGQIVETGLVDEIFYQACHPYTRGLLESIPDIHDKVNELRTIPGTPPDLVDPPKGCPFAARCPQAMKVCRLVPPAVKEISPTHRAACWLMDDRAAAARRARKEGSK